MIITVTTTMTSAKTDASIWFVMQVVEESIRDIHETLAEDGVISGDRIYTDRQGARTVEREREEMIVGNGVIATIKPCHIDFEIAPNPTYIQARSL